MIAAALSLTACIEDGYTTSASQQPVLECDTLSLGTVFTDEPTPTSRFKVYNPHDRILVLDRIALRADDESMWRLNVDGISGNSQSAIEIRPNDSIFVFVEATLPDLDLTTPVNYKGYVDIEVKGVTTTMVLDITGRDATRLTGYTVTADEHFDASKPYIIYDSLVVAEGATLTLEAGVKLNFHADASMTVNGTLISRGEAGNEVEMTGDRHGNVVGRVDYELMSGQWAGVLFSPSSRASHLEYTSIRNTTSSVIVDSVAWTPEAPSLFMLNCQLRNSQGYALVSSFSRVEAIGCELADASISPVALQGGEALLSNCTLANYYLFTAPGGPTLTMTHAIPGKEIEDIDLPLLKADINNCIIYGNNAKTMSYGDLTDSDIYVRNTLLKSTGEDDDHFISCLWDIDPLYYTVRADYLFDYRLKPESPAIGAADPELIHPLLSNDRYGRPLEKTLGAYSSRPE